MIINPAYCGAISRRGRRSLLAQFIAFVQADWPWFAIVVVALVASARFERHWARLERGRWHGRWRGNRHAKPAALLDRVLAATEAAAVQPFDPAEQLRHVERCEFRPRRLLNRGEARLFGVLESACAAEASDWRVMAQVCLGEILSSPSEAAFRAINSKRVDLLIVSAEGEPLHAVELQGSGHHLGPAATRDAIKKEALRKAGIGYVEVKPGDTPAEIRALVAKLVRARRPIATA